VIAVIGSNNVDLVLTVDHFTNPGETQSCISFERFSGGKGANQAIACKKLGATVRFLTCVGDDENGQFILQNFSENGIAEFAVKVRSPNGFAMIEVTKTGENRIIIYAGANGFLTPETVRENAPDLLETSVLLLQNEIPFQTSFEAAKLFKANGKMVIFDPAPAHGIDSSIFKFVDIITPNESELIALTQISSVREAIDRLLKSGCKNVLLKMGEKGCIFKGEYGEFYVESFKVNAVDTTAAGDIFNAAFAVGFCRFGDIYRALVFASASAAISVTRKGAQSSIPFYEEVAGFLNARGGNNFTKTDEIL